MVVMWRKFEKVLRKYSSRVSIVLSYKITRKILILYAAIRK
jgi:hypothetical protein